MHGSAPDELATRALAPASRAAATTAGALESGNNGVQVSSGDRAGKAAAWRALENSLAHVRDGRQIRFLFLPDGHDPDSLVGAEGRDAFEARLQNAETLSAYFLRHLRDQVDMTNRDGRARFKELARPLLERIPDGAFRDILEGDVDRLAQIDTGLLAAKSASHSAAVSRSASAGRGSVVRQAIRALVHYPQIATKAPSADGLAGIDRPGIPLLMELLNDLQESPCANTATLLERWRGRPDFDPLFKLASTECHFDAAGAARELNDALAQLFPERGDQRLDELLRKQAREGLTRAERTELQGFLTRPAGDYSQVGQRT